MGILKDRFLLITLFSSLLIRLVLTPIPGFKFDVDVWFAWAERLNQLGFSNFYSDQVWTNYTPGFLYILGILGFLKNLLGIQDGLFYAILKLPSLIAEPILALLIFKLLNKKSFFWATIATGTILLNPAFIFNSAIWGQIDGFLTLFMFLSVYFLSGKKMILASIFLGLSFLIKPQAIALMPVVIFYLINNCSIRNIAQLFLPGTMTVFILSLPFFPKEPFELLQLFSKMVSDYSYNSLFAYNFWGSLGFWIRDDTVWGSLSYQYWGYIIYGCYLLLLAYFYLKGTLSLYTVSALSVLAFFLLPTRVHERYLYPAIVFLIFLSAILKSRLILILTILLSFTHFLNLYYVYVYYNEFYLKLPKTLYLPFLYNFLDNSGRLMSIISTTLFILISIIIIKSRYVSKKA